MILLVVKREGRYLKSAEGLQALEWTKDVRKAYHFNAAATSYAYQLADTYSCAVLKHDTDTNRVFG